MRRINVTETYLPSLSSYNTYLKRVWKTKWLTNRGGLVLDLEDKLKSFLNVRNLTLTTNGTLPIQIAIKSLGLEGEIITTPFSYVATTSSIVWENCKPVFVDIDPDYLTIDEEKIEERLTENTTAILATHVFGNPCAVKKIEEIAKVHKLKVIYDAAHCFGVKYQGRSIFEYGDVSTCSFHATKIFHTGEGGCFISKDDELHSKMYYHHNFGHDGPINIQGLGVNAKMSELQAAMGLAVFEDFEFIISKRQEVVNMYNEKLDFNTFRRVKIRSNTKWNYHYYPVIFDSEELLLKAQHRLNDSNIFPRRYFYPSLNRLKYVDTVDMPVSDSISKRIVCLPLSTSLTENEIHYICKLLNSNS